MRLGLTATLRRLAPMSRRVGTFEDKSLFSR
jgi:hypothetical protein